MNCTETVSAPMMIMMYAIICTSYALTSWASSSALNRSSLSSALMSSHVHAPLPNLEFSVEMRNPVFRANSDCVWISRCAHLVRMIFRIVVARVSTGLCAHGHFDIVLAFLSALCYNVINTRGCVSILPCSVCYTGQGALFSHLFFLL